MSIPLNPKINHAPRRKDILTPEEKKLAIKNALRYFDKKYHPQLINEFADELKKYGRIYMFRFRPDYKMHARPICDLTKRSTTIKARIMIAATTQKNSASVIGAPMS